MAGRHEVPVDPAAGPVQRFAFELRKLRAEADGITYRALARRAGYSVTTLAQAAGGERLPTLPVALAYAEACGGDPAEWEARWKEAVEESAGDESRDDDGSLPPYRGLARFETGDSGLFFGREQLTDDLVELLRRRRFAAVFGPSGSGKSSLLRAGLIPVLRHAQEPDLRPAAIRILTPGERPARNHSSLLVPATPHDGSAGADTFLIVDQFEEVFTLCHDAAERARFIDLLLRARQPESRLRVLLAVRGDFYGRCAEHRGLADALRDANLLAGAMSRAELRAAVVKPAKAAGLTVERALTARLVEEVADAPGGLPLLSHALLETWRRRRGKTLTLAGYEAAGCLDGAIARTAEEVHGRFTDDQAVAARRVLLRLVAPGWGSPRSSEAESGGGTPDTRRPVDRAELSGTGRDDTARVVDALAGARLLTLDGDTVEMAHEALITAWPRLRGWIEEDRERLRVHRDLTEAAHAWQELGREEGALCRGIRLAAAQEHFGGASREELTGLERAFLDASGVHERKGRRRYRLVLTAVTAALCLALVAAGLAVGQWESAVTAQHVAQSRQLAAQSGALLESEPDLASLLAVHAYRISPTREAAAALYDAGALPLSERLVSGKEPVRSLTVSTDGRTVATHSKDGKVRIWELPGGRLRHTFTVPGSGDVAALSAEGRTLAVATSGDAGAVIGLWDPATGRRIRTVTVPEGAVRATEFSPDGRTVAAASASTVRVWDVATGRTRLNFTSEGSRAVAFGPHGDTVVAASYNGQVRVGDLATGRTRTAHETPRDGYVVAISPDGRTYAVVPADRSWVQLREVATGKLRRTISDRPIGVDDVAFAPDGRTLAVRGVADTVRLWDTASGAARGTVNADHRSRGLTDMALCLDGRTLVTSSSRDSAIRIHRLSADRPRLRLPGDAATFISDIAFSPEGHTAATVRQAPPGRGAVELWDASTGDRDDVLTLDTEPAPRREEIPFTVSRFGTVGFSRSGRALAARATKNEVIEVREVTTSRLLQRRALRNIDTAVFSPDGTRLALVSHDGSVRIWHLSSGALHTAYPGHDEPARTLAFAPDGRTLAVAHIKAGHEQVRLLDAATGRIQRTIKPSAGDLLSLAFSPDGDTLATASSAKGAVKTWNARTGQLRDSFNVSGDVAALAFSSDGSTLAASNERGVHLWDLATSQIRRTLPIRPQAGAVRFSPDGHTLAISVGPSVELWNIELPDPARAIRDICAAIDTTLTPLEQSRYLPDQSTETGCPAAKG
ncbi:helix-turn-helix domain-containing protein [Streptomyces sp. NPDC008137]|uniref:nSTAND1 domain-containing NTPase n=1 Tax=Streptomyces sp. NPDC008137 TaxID=3364813 RepID=UPI0036E95B79